MKNELGKVRQSTVVMNYGPGAIIDFRVPNTGAAVSAVAASLEQWEIQTDEAGISSHDLRRLTDPRLKRKLGVEYFRLPPVSSDIWDGKEEDDEDAAGNGDSITVPLIGVRFPQWLQCPKCNHLKPAKKWGHNPGDPSRFCASCSHGLPGGQKIYVVPSRFIISCRNGHLDDFPWSHWVHRRYRKCQNDSDFIIKSEGPGLAGLTIYCTKCPAHETMENIFRREAFDDFSCTGKRPWIANGDEKCDQHPIAMQRGASNLYFPQIESALVIPPWSEQVIKSIGYRWDDLARTNTVDDRHKYIEKYVWEELDDDVKKLGLQEFEKLVDEKFGEAKNALSDNLRWDEYQQFQVAKTRRNRPGDEFKLRVETAGDQLPYLSKLIRVVSVREIRVLKSFSRVEAPPGRPPVRTQFLSKMRLKWLPAIDVRGEGIFVSLDAQRLSEWLSKDEVRRRARNLAHPEDSRVLNPDSKDIHLDDTLVSRYLLLHSLSHVLMKQLALQCGYSSASLRERIYAGSDPQSMAGILIYTSTSDSDGTLGGLQREGKSSRFTSTFEEAIRSNQWCSSDPLCIKGLLSSSDSSNLASCHSCLLAPETSCEDYNRFLDRATLVGTPEIPSLGFFRQMVELTR